MTARYATDAEIQKWNTLIVANPDGGNVFSSYEYLEQKRHTGYTPHYVIVDNIAVGILEKSTPPLGRFWYLPKGPGVTTVAQLHKTLEALKPLAIKRRAFMMRIESELSAKEEPLLKKRGLMKAAAIIPNASTITLDISPTLDDLLTSLPQKGRHAIRRAERDGVIIKRVDATAKNCRTMYQLLTETAEGQFGIRRYDYFKSYWQRFAQAGNGQLFFAYYDKKVVAGAFAMILGEKSTYKDGASSRKRPAYGASHLLQWQVIQWAKENGATIHDFCGSPPSAEINNTSHHHYGVGRFKLSFSRTVVDYIGCYDLVLNPPAHLLWRRGFERAYRHFYYKKTKDYYY